MSAKREHLVKTALQLFYRDGINATGIDKVLQESGVAKMTLYNHFKSKDELIAATLDLQDQIFNNIVESEIAKHKDPIKKVLAVFDALEVWFGGKNYRGCYFINTVAEMGSSDGPIQKTCRKHKKQFGALFKTLLKEGGIKNAEKLTGQLSLLAEGAIVQSLVMNDKTTAKTAQSAAKVLLAN